MIVENFFQKRSDFVRNALKLVSGTALAQGISLLIAPLITRLYSPADFGAFTFLISLAGTFGLIGTLRYEMAILLPKEDEKAINIAILSFKIAFIIAMVLVFLAIIANIANPSLRFFTESVCKGVLIVPLLVIMISAGNIAQNWFNRQNHYKIIALSRVANSAGNNTTTLIFGFLGFGVWGLLFGNFLGQVVMLLLLAVYFSKGSKNFFKQSNRSLQRKLASHYRELPLANTPQVLVELVQVYGIVFLLRFFSDDSTLGWYALAQRLLQAPLWLVGAALCQVYYKEASSLFAAGHEIRPVLFKTIRLAFFSVFPVLLVLLFAGPWLISFIFGESWRESGEIARILAPWFFLDFIRYSISQTPLILGKTRQMLLVSMSGAIGIVVGITVGSTFSEHAFAGFILLSAIMSLHAIFVIAWNIWIASKACNTLPNQR